ncbi:MAG: sulfatase-like hydrolase/transferase [Gemmatimonadaceae bacterium]
MLGLTFATVSLAQPSEQPRSPNIVLILMDDLGYGDLGSYGVPDAKTPNIDRLAREGVKLTDFYANAAECSPTRTALITGRYQQRYGIEWRLGSQPGDSARGLLPSETSLPRLLESAGYVTGLIGKWHLGWKPEFHPNRHGFDEFWGFLGGAVDYYSNVDARGRHDLFHNDTATTQSGYLTDEITARAKAFIEIHRAKTFFLEVAYNATHWPFQPPGLATHQRARLDGIRDSKPPDLERRIAILREGTRADYVAMLESADRGVGEILTTLDRLNLSHNTLVIFTSDNGGEWLSRNAPLFHRKLTLWEGGIRVPALIRWPARLPAGVVSQQVGITMDLSASILAAAGVTPPPGYRAEGIDLIPLLERRRLVERTLFWRIEGPGRLQRAVRRGRWKYLRDGGTRTGGGYEFLFDLETDAGERNDLAPIHAAMLPELRKLLAAWEADVDSSRSALTSSP